MSAEIQDMSTDLSRSQLQLGKSILVSETLKDATFFGGGLGAESRETVIPFEQIPSPSESSPDPERFFTNAPLVAPTRPKEMKSFEGFWGTELDEELLEVQQLQPTFSNVFLWVHKTYTEVRAFARFHADGSSKFLKPIGHDFYITHRYMFPSLGALQETAEHVRTKEGSEDWLYQIEKVMRYIHYIFRYLAWWDLQPTKRFSGPQPPKDLKRKRNEECDIQRIEETQRSRYLPPQWTRSQWNRLCQTFVRNRLPE